MYFSIIIPTLNREKDLEITLESLLWCNTKPIQTLIIDQSSEKATKNLTSEARFESLYIHYKHTSTLSWAKARNLAIGLLDPRSELVIFLDDDISLNPDFFDQISDFFEKNKNSKWIVANIAMPNRRISWTKKIWLFLLTGKFEIKSNIVTNWGFNAMPFDWWDEIRNVERTCGCGMAFRKKIFDEWIRFPDSFMKYSLMEDCFISYEVLSRYPHSLFFLPKAKMIHRESPASRIPNRARILQNIIHRYSFVQKFQKSVSAYLWTMLVFMAFDLLNYKDISVIKRYYQGLSWIWKHRKNIEKSNFNHFIFSQSESDIS